MARSVWAGVTSPKHQLEYVLPDALRLDETTMDELSIGYETTPQYMRSLAERIAELKEARDQGLDTPMDGTMKALTSEIKSALTSGVVDDSRFLETPPIAP